MRKVLTVLATLGILAGGLAAAGASAGCGSHEPAGRTGTGGAAAMGGGTQDSAVPTETGGFAPNGGITGTGSGGIGSGPVDTGGIATGAAGGVSAGGITSLGGAGGVAGSGGVAGGGVVGSGGSVPEPGEGARLEVRPPSVDIGTIDPGATASAYLTVTNVGTVTSGGLHLDFGPGVTNMGHASTALAPQGKLYLTVDLAPTAEGTFSTWASISADPGTTEALRVPITGMVAATGPFVVSPREVSLGVIETTQWVEITITAIEPMTGLTVTLESSDMSIDSTTCTAVMDKGTSCRVEVEVSPDRWGSFSSDVVISAGGTNGKTVYVRISATGTE